MLFAPPSTKQISSIKANQITFLFIALETQFLNVLLNTKEGYFLLFLEDEVIKNAKVEMCIEHHSLCWIQNFDRH